MVESCIWVFLIKPLFTQAEALEKPERGGATPLDRQVLGLAAVAAALQSCGADGLLWGDGAMDRADAAGLQWVFGMVGIVSELGSAVERAKVEALPLLAALAEKGVFTSAAPVRFYD